MTDYKDSKCEELITRKQAMLDVLYAMAFIVVFYGVIAFLASCE